jgi:Holliday junction resolvase RusA-like endonuclease
LHKLDIKPLSVNQAWGGRTFKSNAYKTYERDIAMILPSIKVPEGPLKIRLHWGFSSKASDTDNPIKPFVDCLQRSYDFDDKHVFEYHVTKEVVKRGKEFIEFSIEPIIDLI